MKRTLAFLLGIVLSAGCCPKPAAPAADPVDYVSTLVGTQSKYELSTGNTYPAIARRGV